MSFAEIVEAAAAVVEQELGVAPPDVVRPTALRSAASLAGRIDHTLLRADATAAEIEQLCAEADRYRFASVCVNSRWVPLAADLLKQSPVMVCTVVGFPLGAMAMEAKGAEATVAVAQGADEVDMVIDIGALKSGRLRDLLADMEHVAKMADGRPVKVILETCLLTDEEKAIACLLALRAPVAYVKTSTGFSSGGATVGDIALMRSVVGSTLGVKASGGIRTAADALAMLEAGADRIGASASIAIVSGASDIHSEAEETLSEINWQALHKVATEALRHAYSPYSQFPVAVAGFAEDGRLVWGVNVENASYGLTLCAECSMISHLTMTGGGRLVAAWCVDGRGETLMPCGRCRQLLYEHGGPTMQLMTPHGVQTMTQVLPQAFGPDSIREVTDA